jgi:hypothetical protein
MRLSSPSFRSIGRVAAGASACLALAAPLAAAAAVGNGTPPPHASFGRAAASPDARQLADWVLASRDSDGQPFLMIDKRQARLYVFDAAGKLRGDSPVLLGLARGDDSVPGIGERKLADIKPAERTTPAGRFVGEPGVNVKGEDIVWVDYDAAVSMHRVRANNPKERRLQRLASPTVADNRISYGCINVPAAFYDAHVSPLFASTPAIIYVLPETRPLEATFGLKTGPSNAGRPGAVNPGPGKLSP